MGRVRFLSLVEMGRIPVTSEPHPKVFREGLERVAEMRNRREYVSTLTNVDLSKPFGIAMQVADPSLGGSLFLGGGEKGPGGNGRADALAGLKELGCEVPGPDGLEVTGWWEVDQPKADLVVSSQAIVLGMTGGIVFSAAQVVGPYYQMELGTKKAFPVREIVGEELAGYVGYIEKTGRTTTYVQL